MDAKTIYNLWRPLRRETVDHKLTCDCRQCHERRKLARQIVLPYAGAPANLELSHDQ